MYFPYLRGKLFELIALKELKSFLSLNKTLVSPIIEPVKSTKSKNQEFKTLKNTLVELRNADINFNFIVNPTIVNDVDSYTLIDALTSALGSYENFQIAFIVDKGFDISNIKSVLTGISFKYKGVTLIHETEIPEIDKLVNSLSVDFNIIYNVIYFEKTNRRYYTNFPKNTIVSLDDFFNIQPRNANYLEIGESPFSSEYKFFKDDNFAGFSDFLTIGDLYTESGFLPYAVAIHISYEENNKIWIKHFVSDSNDDTSDIAGKFAEALQKLVNWCDNQNCRETYGLKKFYELYNTGHFPGLGSVKKLSIMHHIELVINLLKNEVLR